MQDTAWLDKRQQMYLSQLNGDQEVVLADGEGCVNEGASSNFFVIMNDTVFTANGPHVLRGTVRALVLAVCADNDIPVCMTGPPANQWSTWQVSTCAG